VPDLYFWDRKSERCRNSIDLDRRGKFCPPTAAGIAEAIETAAAA
jgi:hypothetical protein